MEENLYDHGLAKISQLEHKNTNCKRETDMLDFIKAKNSGSSKDTGKKMKETAQTRTMWISIRNI